MSNLFQNEKPDIYNLREKNKCDVKFAAGERLFKSTVPTLQRLLNIN